jgi:hypothetical protein
MNLALVKQQLGHKSIGSTMRYAAVRDEQASKETAAPMETNMSSQPCHRRM